MGKVQGDCESLVNMEEYFFDYHKIMDNFEKYNYSISAFYVGLLFVGRDIYNNCKLK